MSTKTTIDKSDWPRGPWDDEPDKKTWRDAGSGMDCMVRRGPGGHWCGYVGLPEGHPWHGIEYSTRIPFTDKERKALDRPAGTMSPITMICAGDVEKDGISLALLLDCHGGLTYSDRISDDEALWWLGFDCAHVGDLAPKFGVRCGDDTYRDLEYVEDQCARLAKQIASYAKAEPSHD